MEGNPALPGDVPDLTHGLEGPDLGVGVHDGDEDGVGPEVTPDLIGIHHAVAVDGEIGDLEPEGLEALARPEYGVVLDPRGDDVSPAAGHGHALDGHVVRFGAARREHDLLLPHPEEVSDLLARRLEPFASLAAEGVDARRIAEPLGEVG